MLQVEVLSEAPVFLRYFYTCTEPGVELGPLTLQKIQPADAAISSDLNFRPGSAGSGTTTFSMMLSGASGFPYTENRSFCGFRLRTTCDWQSRCSAGCNWSRRRDCPVPMTDYQHHCEL